MAIRALFIAFVLAVLSAGVMAQGRGGMRMMGGQDNPAFLLMREDVRRDLAITADQASKLQEMQDGMRERMMARMQEMQGADREAMQAEFRKMQDEATKQLNGILTPDQQKRLREISIQLAGPRAAMREDVAKELGITAQQRQQMQNLMQRQREANQSIMERMRNGEMDRDQVRDAMQRNNTALNTELEKVLTDAQKAKLKEMGGKEFKADPDNAR